MGLDHPMCQAQPNNCMHMASAYASNLAIHCILQDNEGSERPFVSGSGSQKSSVPSFASMPLYLTCKCMFPCEALSTPEYFFWCSVLATDLLDHGS